MRVMITIAGAYAYVQPMIPLALELEAAGHDVVVCCQPRMEAVVREAGLRSVGVFENASATPTPELVREKAPQWCRQLLEVAREHRPDLVVREWTELGGLIVAVELGVPCVVVGIKMRPAPSLGAAHPCMALMEEAMNGVGAAGDAFGLDIPRLVSRQAAITPAGAAPTLDMSLLFGDLFLSFYPPSFAWPGTLPLAREHFVRPPLYDKLDGVELPGWWNDLGDDPIVYVTLGTSYNQVKGVFEGLVTALADLEAQIVVTVGLDRDPAALGALPDNVHVERYIPNTLIMARATAAVIHGGSNTIFSAFTSGVPFVCLPVGGIQPLQAQRCVDLGLALSYGDGEEVGLDSGAVDAAQIRNLTRRVLQEPSFAAAAARMVDEIRSLPAVSEAVPLIEEMFVRESA